MKDYKKTDENIVKKETGQPETEIIIKEPEQPDGVSEALSDNASDIRVHYKPEPPEEEKEEAADAGSPEENSIATTGSSEENDIATTDSSEENDSSVTEKELQRNRRSKYSVEDIREDSSDEMTEKPSKAWTVFKTTLLALVLFLMAVILTFGYSLWKEFARPTSADGKDIEVTIEEGASTKEVAKELREAGVIRYESPFLLKMYFSDYKGKLRYGTFQLNDGMCLDDIIKGMATGGAQKKELVFTIPEGYTIEMTAKKLEQEGIMSAKEFTDAVKEAASDFVYAGQLPAADKVSYQLQGYLYPDTYFISEDMTGEELVEKILKEFETKFDASRQEAAKNAGMTVEEVLIRASLVQKETEKPEEYPIIAGVINNRLAKDMKLQFDSTAVYALTDGLYGIGRVTYNDLKVDSPYNTYKYKGLPAGPICSPSLEAIDGVLYPQEHKYLYFQIDKTKNDGSNLFFETYEEHTAASATTQAPETETKATKKESEPDKNTTETIKQ